MRPSPHSSLRPLPDGAGDSWCRSPRPRTRPILQVRCIRMILPPLLYLLALQRACCMLPWLCLGFPTSHAPPHGVRRAQAGHFPEQRHAIRACLAAAQPSLAADAPLLAHLLGVSLEAEPLPSLPPAEQKRRLQHACVQAVGPPALAHAWPWRVPAAPRTAAGPRMLSRGGDAPSRSFCSARWAAWRPLASWGCSSAPPC
jgi:hypothetical protein